MFLLRSIGTIHICLKVHQQIFLTALSWDTISKTFFPWAVNSKHALQFFLKFIAQHYTIHVAHSWDPRGSALELIIIIFFGAP